MPAIPAPSEISCAAGTKSSNGSTLQSRCGGFFFNAEECEGYLPVNVRVCSRCHEFSISTARVLLCHSKNSPFAPRKRTILLNSTSMPVRFFSVPERENLNASKADIGLLERTQHICDKSAVSPGNTVSCELVNDALQKHDGVLVFANIEEAKLCLDAFPGHLTSLPACLGDKLQFNRCSRCNRKVFPSSLIPSCSRPSCMAKLRDMKCKRKLLSKTQPSSGSPVGEVADKRRRRWRVWSSSSSSSPANPRVVIESPEPLCCATLSVQFGSVVLCRDQDFFCGRSEIVIPRAPAIEQHALVNLDNRSIFIAINDDNGVSGNLLFTYDAASSKVAATSAATNDATDIDAEDGTVTSSPSSSPALLSFCVQTLLRSVLLHYVDGSLDAAEAEQVNARREQFVKALAADSHSGTAQCAHELIRKAMKTARAVGIDMDDIEAAFNGAEVEEVVTRNNMLELFYDVADGMATVPLCALEQFDQEFYGTGAETPEDFQQLEAADNGLVSVQTQEEMLNKLERISLEPLMPVTEAQDTFDA